MARGPLITFPPGVLGEAPVRLPVVAQGPGFFAVVKPAGLVVVEDPLHEGVPALAPALREALRAGKRQLAELGIAGAEPVHGLDAEITGVVVFATSDEAAAALRNSHGSSRWTFEFELVSERGPGARELECRLPLAVQEERRRVAVSHRDGKKSATSFALVRDFGRYGSWRARTAHPRLHQVRAHAAECGLRIPGERIYVRVRQVFLSNLKPGYRPGREEERPLHAPLCLHLARVRFPAPDGVEVEAAAPPPRSFAAVLARIEEAGW